MKLVFIIGDSAVDKMTVGQELMKRTQLRLFHNHMSIEPILEIFGTFNRSAIDQFRSVIFEEFAKSDRYGMIFTYMWDFDDPSDWAYVDYVKSVFAPYDAEFYCVELVAPQSVRLERNRSANRLAHKPSKRNLEWSDKMLRHINQHCRLESRDGELPFENYMKIDNSNLAPEVVAEMIQARFSL